MKSAFRLLADSGFGGERSRGWGRAATPEFSDASSLLPSKVSEENAWWLLSMYSPAASDAVDWSRGEYGATQRGGWTDSQSGVAPKKQVRMLEEGSVLYAPALRGQAVNVAPEGFPHPVYRAGFALAVPAPHEPVPVQRQAQPVTTPEPEAQESEAVAEMEYEGDPSAPEPSVPEPDSVPSRDCKGAVPPPTEPEPTPETAPSISTDLEAEAEMEYEGDPSTPTNPPHEEPL